MVIKTMLFIVILTAGTFSYYHRKFRIYTRYQRNRIKRSNTFGYQNYENYTEHLRRIHQIFGHPHHSDEFIIIDKVKPTSSSTSLLKTSVRFLTRLIFSSSKSYTLISTRTSEKMNFSTRDFIYTLLNSLNKLVEPSTQSKTNELHRFSFFTWAQQYSQMPIFSSSDYSFPFVRPSREIICDESDHEMASTITECKTTLCTRISNQNTILSKSFSNSIHQNQTSANPVRFMFSAVQSSHVHQTKSAFSEDEYIASLGQSTMSIPPTMQPSVSLEYHCLMSLVVPLRTNSRSEIFKVQWIQDMEMLFSTSHQRRKRSLEKKVNVYVSMSRWLVYTFKRT